MTAKVENNLNYSTIITYQIDFLSSGSVMNLQPRYKQYLNTTDGDMNFEIMHLFYGGSIITSWTYKCYLSKYVDGYTNTDNTMDCVPRNLTGYIIPPDGNEQHWDLNLIPTFSSATIPTTSDRLHLTNRMQYDPSTLPYQYLLQIEILAPNNNYQTPVYQIIKDLDTLIKEKDTSIISMNNHTKYLDSSYG
ncbi:11606_t:CDS:2, partial [Racocetra fulgida]